jgi:hypothetical protein
VQKKVVIDSGSYQIRHGNVLVGSDTFFFGHLFEFLENASTDSNAHQVVTDKWFHKKLQRNDPV